MKNSIAILAATVWISISEFIRNQYLVQSFWVDHYKALGQTFPAEPLNGAVWGIWSLVFAILIFIISRKFNVIQTAGIAWVAGFAMMWLVIGDLSALPFGILAYTIPLSMLEVLLASWLVKKISPAVQPV